MNIGSKVVYIEKSMPELGLINGKTYTVYGIADCGTEGHAFCIDVGLKLPEGKKFVICEECLNIIHIGEEFYLDHTGFKELEENTEENILEEVYSIINENAFSFKTLSHE